MWLPFPKMTVHWEEGVSKDQWPAGTTITHEVVYCR